MKVRVKPSVPSGKISAIASKSMAHRLLICAAFADEKSEIICKEVNDDIMATVNCLNAMGAEITRKNESFTVLPIKNAVSNPLLECNESGSTLRFLLPVICALGCGGTFKMCGRLSKRPLSPLREELENHGAIFSSAYENLLCVSGKIEGDCYKIKGDVSSQFISGLLFAAAISEGETKIEIEGEIQSAPYINMTSDALDCFGVGIDFEDGIFTVCGKEKLTSPSTVEVEGDWSNAAFALCAAAISKKGKVSVSGLDPESMQGDRKIIEILVRFGADVRRKEDCFTVKSGKLFSMNVDASQIPDLVPIISLVAACAEGRTVIYGASRLKLKESDRLESTRSLLSSLGADIITTDDGLIISGGNPLTGGEVCSFNDHRIAMTAAIAATVCQNDVIIDGAEAVSKSYPDFFDDIQKLGIEVVKE